MTTQSSVQTSTPYDTEIARAELERSLAATEPQRQRAAYKHGYLVATQRYAPLVAALQRVYDILDSPDGQRLLPWANDEREHARAALARLKEGA